MPWSRVRERRVGRRDPPLDPDPDDAADVVDAERKKIECNPPSSGLTVFVSPDDVVRFECAPSPRVLTTKTAKNDEYVRDRCVSVRRAGIRRALPRRGFEVRIMPSARLSRPSIMRRMGSSFPEEDCSCCFRCMCRLCSASDTWLIACTALGKSYTARRCTVSRRVMASERDSNEAAEAGLC